MNKRIVATLLAFLIALTLFTFTACAPSKTVSAVTRWEKGETFAENYTYVISLANNDASSDVTANDLTFKRNFLSVNTEADQCIPSDVEGTLTTSLVAVDGNVTFTMHQSVVETFDKLNANYAYAEMLFNDANSSKINAVKNADDSLSFTSVTTTEVTFMHKDAQTPVRSQKTIVGFYVGKQAQEINEVSYVCTYQDGVATTVLTQNGETETKTTDVANGTLDVNQLLVFARTLEKDVAYPDRNYQTPSVKIFDPLTNQTHLISFQNAVDKRAVLSDGQDNLLAEVGVLSIYAVSGNYNIQLYSLEYNPKSQISVTGVGALNSYHTVRFQNGYYVFEQNGYSQTETEQLRYVE